MTTSHVIEATNQIKNSIKIFTQDKIRGIPVTSYGYVLILMTANGIMQQLNPEKFAIKFSEI